eukprot:4834729-Pyramimonas_sp.AAC.1
MVTVTLTHLYHVRPNHGEHQLIRLVEGLELLLDGLLYSAVNQLHHVPRLQQRHDLAHLPVANSLPDWCTHCLTGELTA